ADGLRHLERNINRGDANDLYPLASNKVFGPDTRPASNLHYKVNGVRQPSTITISAITQLVDGGITFHFGAKPAAVFLSDRSSGCVPFTVKFYNQSFGAQSCRWYFDDHNYSDSLSPQYEFKTSGNHTVKLVVFKDDVAVDSSEI